MKNEFGELAKKILNTNRSDDRERMEDELVEMAYVEIIKWEVTPEELETARDAKREKTGPLKIEGDLRVGMKKLLDEKLKVMEKANSKEKVVESLGDVLEIVETFTATF